MKNMLPSYIPKNTTVTKECCAEGKSELSVEFSDLTDDQMMAIVLLKMNSTQCEHLWFGSQQDKGHVINVKYFRK